jgi:ATP-dependent helicase/nuclease subunit A
MLKGMVLLMSGGRNWTKEQKEAITEQSFGMLVSAAAGAGKTAVLVERVIHKITDANNPVDIDRLLVMTFTNAAASEMRERIAGAITERLEVDPGSQNILRQLTLLENASITTIHSFCLEVIRSNFQLIGIDPKLQGCRRNRNSAIKD